MTERWKDIPGYEGFYQVSDLGRVRRTKSGRVLKPHYNGHGYIQALLSKRGERKHKAVHRLVASAFIPNPEGKPQINHKNGVKSDNTVSNLEWCTASENLTHRHRVLGLPGCRSKKVVCLETGVVYPSAKAAAEAIGVNRTAVAQCCLGTQKTSKKLHFKFKEEQTHEY